jgi:hypothetical protein
MLNSRDVLKLGAAAILVVCLCLGGGREAKALYDVKPDEIPGRPGSIIRIWPLEGAGPAGARADAFRILYRSTGLKGGRSPSPAPSWCRTAQRRPVVGM